MPEQQQGQPEEGGDGGQDQPTSGEDLGQEVGGFPFEAQEGLRKDAGPGETREEGPEEATAGA